MDVTVLGATGGIGRTIVDELVSRGHEVTAVSRSVGSITLPEGARSLPADITDPVAVARACAGSDVVVMAASLPYAAWHTELQPFVDGALQGAAAAGARFVMVDNLYAYGSPTGPITDASPLNGPTRKAEVRRRLAARLLAAHERGDTSVSIGRFSDYYGAHGDNSLIGMLIIDRILRGKHPQAFIDADQPHTFAYLPDAARGFATLVERPDADGRSWILPAGPPVTQRQLADLVSEAAGAPLRLRRITPAMLLLAGCLDAQLREAREQVPQFDRPYEARGDDFVARFGPVPITPHPEAVATTVAARRSRQPAATSLGR